MSARDSQRARCYAAECRAWARVLVAGAPGIAGSHDKLSREEIALYLGRLKRSAFFRRRFPAANGLFEVVASHTQRRAMYNARNVWRPERYSFPRETSRWLVLHELAHAAAHHAAPAREGCHGRTFARAYLALVRWQFGRAAWAILRDEFRRGGVKYVRPPIVRARQAEPEAFRRYRESLACNKVAAASGIGTGG